MNALVVYDSRFGNTAEIAQAIARALGARVFSAAEFEPMALDGAELVIVGAPTQHHRPSPAMQVFLDTLMRNAMGGRTVAVFDTRYQMARWRSGSAGSSIARRLRKAGGQLLVPVESFFVEKREGPLVAGELERASRWTEIIRYAYADRAG